MNENTFTGPTNEVGSEEYTETLLSSLDRFRKSIENDTVRFEKMAGIVRRHIADFQSAGILPSELMLEQDRRNLIVTFCIALDQRFVSLDDEASVSNWIKESASNIYQAPKIKKTDR